jgi:BolA protein
MGMKERLEAKLRETLNPVSLEVKNDSHLHAGHGGDDGSGESHFSITVVSRAFEGQGKIMCHRMIYSILSEEMKKIHALSITALIPQDE